MKNTFGNNVSVTIFGESHGEEIGVIIDGLAPGLEVDNEFIASQLDKRRPVGKISTSRQEADEYRIVSGVFEGKTTGTPICILIPNTSTKSKDYSLTRELARPGHADYTAFMKYHGYEDYRGGGHFSGRITAGLVAGGAIAIKALEKKNIFIGTHIKRCAKIDDIEFCNLKEDITKLNNKMFATLDDEIGVAMQDNILKAAEVGDSVGGILETAIIGLPAGLGEPWFDSIESILSHVLFSIPALKGVQFGNAFDKIDLRGSEYNDIFRIEEDKVVTKTNNNAGINGGITNGMPILFQCAIKPTPSIFKTQDTINFMKNENAELNLKGRHDPAIIHRARIVIDSIVALVLCDILEGRYGTDYLA